MYGDGCIFLHSLISIAGGIANFNAALFLNNDANASYTRQLHYCVKLKWRRQVGPVGSSARSFSPAFPVTHSASFLSADVAMTAYQRILE